MRYERVLVGHGEKAHLRYDDIATLCGIGPVDNSKSTEGYPLCRQCSELKERLLCIEPKEEAQC